MKSIKYIVIVIALSLTSCEIGLNNCVNGDGNKVEQEIEIDGEIRAIEFRLSGEIVLQQGDTQMVIIEGDQNIIDLIERESTYNNGKWTIDSGVDCVDADGLKISVRLKSLTAISLVGSGDIKSENTLETTDFFIAELDGSGKIDLELEPNLQSNIELLGSGDIQIKCEAEQLIVALNGSGNIDVDNTIASTTNVEVQGSGEIKLDGASNQLKIDHRGSADIKADDYKSQDCEINMEGSGDIEVYVEQTLDVNITGSGDVCYKGNPTININITGSGDLRECN